MNFDPDNPEETMPDARPIEEKFQLFLGDCIDVMRGMADNSVDSIVTDPPYELGFMGKKWDSTGIAYSVKMWSECFRILKPGGHLLSFSGTRTYHRMAVAIEDAGFEVRDMIEWVYGSGFPKSHDIGKSVDKIQGNEREVIDHRDVGHDITNNAYKDAKPERKIMDITKGSSEWEGWGTALKPAHEPICLARKPISEKTVAKNVLKHGTGGINIDGSRIELNGDYKCGANGRPSQTGLGDNYDSENANKASNVGRFPANLIHDNSEEIKACFPNSKGQQGDVLGTEPSRTGGDGTACYGKYNRVAAPSKRGDNGSAARFFKSIIYQSKASKKDRGEGNNHPTVKPVALMEYLVKMVTPKGGLVLDPFNGSGTTGCAAVKNGFIYKGIDETPEYIEISKTRIKSYVNNQTELF